MKPHVPLQQIMNLWLKRLCIGIGKGQEIASNLFYEMSVRDICTDSEQRTTRHTDRVIHVFEHSCVVAFNDLYASILSDSFNGKIY